MDDVNIDAIGPIISENLVVAWVAEWRISRKCDGRPTEALLSYIV